MEMMARKRVIIFGIGGVGSWCAEALVRTGVQHLTIVDFDRVDVTNVNRQLMATSKTIGEVKVEALRKRLLTINTEDDGSQTGHHLWYWRRGLLVCRGFGAYGVPAVDHC